jgi:thioredoxin-related protein
MTVIRLVMALLIATIASLLLFVGCSKTPTSEMQAADRAIESARGSEADRYAATEFQAALDTLAAAASAKTEQDGKFALFRSYERSRALYAMVPDLAKAAVDKSESARTAIQAESEKQRILAEAEREKARKDSLALATQVKQAPQTGYVTRGASATQVGWVPYDEGLAVAKKTNRHMFVDFTATWCGWCKKMERETFNRPEVIAMLNNNFIPIKVWGDLNNSLNIDGYKITEKEFANSRGVQGYPTFVFETPAQQAITAFTGYRDAATLMNYLTQVKKYIDTVSASGAKAAPGK